MWVNFFNVFGTFENHIFSTIGHFWTIFRLMTVACTCIHGPFFHQTYSKSLFMSTKLQNKALGIISKHLKEFWVSEAIFQVT